MDWKETVINEMKEEHHWKRANKQVIDERNGVPVSGKKSQNELDKERKE